ncbi:hypothetical protein ACFVH6_27445 [Spirillospora sp. NPDC127200]
MVVLSIVIAIVGAACLLDLLLSLGVIRRLREHSEILEKLALLADGNLPVARQESISPFLATTVDGQGISPADIPDQALAAFFAADCDSCRAQAPRLAEWAKNQDLDKDQILVVIDAMTADPMAMVEVLAPVANVVIDAEGTPVTKAFPVSGFPSYCEIRDGAVIAVHAEVGDLPVAPRR